MEHKEMSNSKIVSKTYFIGDLINLVTDLGGTLKDSEQIWREFTALLRKENVLNDKFDLNTEASKVEIDSGFKKAAEFLNEKLSVSGLQICWHGTKRADNTSKIELIEKGTQDINAVVVKKFEATHFFIYLLPEIEDDEMICDVISESAAKITASDSVILNKANERITVTDLKTEAVFAVKD